MTEYYNALMGLWQEINLFYDNNWHCPKDFIRHNKMLEKERVLDFLHSLNKEFDEVRGRLLGSKPLPTIQEAFAEVRREESHRKVMMNLSSSSDHELVNQVSAVTVDSSSNPRSQRGVIIPKNLIIQKTLAGRYMENQQIESPAIGVKTTEQHIWPDSRLRMRKLAN